MTENAQRIEEEETPVVPAEGLPADGAATDGSSAGNGSSAGDGPSAGGGLSTDQVYEALKEVHDPELGINIVDLGLVYDVTIADGVVHITYTLTTMGCPIGPLIEAQMQQLLAGFPGVTGVEAEMVIRPPWTPEMMSEEAKAALGYF
jgi:metal-sulfur cluster biosynthetic enzyme